MHHSHRSNHSSAANKTHTHTHTHHQSAPKRRLRLLPLLLLLHRGVERRAAHHPLSGVEQVDGALAVRDQEALQAQALEQLGLHFRAGPGDLLDGLAADGVHLGLEPLQLHLHQRARLLHLRPPAAAAPMG